MTQVTGKVTNVTTVQNGSVVVADTASGATVVPVNDAFDFEEDGGQVSINGTTYNYTAVDYEADTITLATALTAAVTEGDMALTVPEGTTRWAMVDLSDQDEGIQAVINDALMTVFDEGIRDEADQETVICDDSSDRWQVIGLVGETPMIAGESVMGPLGPVTPSTAPGSTPAIKVSGNATSLVVYSDAFEPGTRIRYYISTTDGFVPSESDFFTETTSRVLVINSMPDGTALQVDTPYFIVGLAVNDIGSAPAYSPQVSDTLHTDVLSDEVMARLVVGFVLAGSIQVGQILIDSADGITIPQPGGRYIRLPVDGSPAEIAANLIAFSLTTDNNLQINNSAVLNGVMDLKAGVTAPKRGPVMSVAWPFRRIDAMTSDANSDLGNVYNGLADHDATTWACAINYFGAAIRLIDKRTSEEGNGWPLGTDYNMAVYPDPTGGKTWTSNFSPVGGIAKQAGYFFLLGSDGNRSGQFYIYKIDPATWDKVAEVNVGSLNVFAGKIPRLLAYDTTRVAIVYVKDSTDTLTIDGYLAADLTFNFTRALYSTIAVQDVGGAIWGPVGAAGANRLVIIMRTGSTFVFTPSGSTFPRITAEEFQRPNSKIICGLGYDATNNRLFAYDNYGRGYRLTRNPTALTVKGAATNYDGAGTTHETTASVVTSYTWPARSWLHVQIDPPQDASDTSSNPDKADRAGLYLTLTTGTPRLESYWAVGKVADNFETVQDTGAVPPTTNGFSTLLSSPGRLKSVATDTGGAAVIDFKGSGEGRMGVYRTAADGSMVTAGVQGWPAGFAPTAVAGTDSSGVRLYPRPGITVVNVNATTTAARVVGDVLFTLPVDLRPPAVITADIIQVSTGASIRVHVNENGTVTTQTAIASGLLLRGVFPVPTM